MIAEKEKARRDRGGPVAELLVQSALRISYLP
jgi:hypothetical protein